MLACLKFWLAGLACFLGDIQATARRLGKKELAKKAIVRTRVHIGTPHDLEGYALAVDIKVDGVSKELWKPAHEVCFDSWWIAAFTKTFLQLCAYRRAFARGAEVKISLAEGTGTQASAKINPPREVEGISTSIAK